MTKVKKKYPNEYSTGDKYAVIKQRSEVAAVPIQLFEFNSRLLMIGLEINRAGIGSVSVVNCQRRFLLMLALFSLETFFQ